MRPAVAPGPAGRGRGGARGRASDAVALFPAVAEALKTPDGREAHNPNGLVPRTLKALKERWPELAVVTDVALDPYNTDGHDGIVAPDGRILNDETVEVLCEQALCQARAGADIVAPSDMMDGRVGAIREALDGEGFTDVSILAYTAKYASAFYGPFRDALDSAPEQRRQEDLPDGPRQRREALREVELDEAEGADIVMVKPGLPVPRRHRARREGRRRCRSPRIRSAASTRCSRRRATRLARREARACSESLTRIRRAGADVILTYFARQAAEWLVAERGGSDEGAARVLVRLLVPVRLRGVDAGRGAGPAGGRELDLRPMLLGGVFQARGTPQNLAATLNPAKAPPQPRRHAPPGPARRRAAAHAGEPPDAHGRGAALRARRPALPSAADPPHLPRVLGRERATSPTRECWRGRSPRSGSTRRRSSPAPGRAEIKDELRRRTDEAIARGVFGVPTYFVGDQLFWGQDRADMVEAALGGAPPTLRRRPTAPVEFFFDYSSPFAYLAIGARRGELGPQVRWRPILLGGLFRSIGTPDVPLFVQSPEKRRHTHAGPRPPGGARAGCRSRSRRGSRSARCCRCAYAGRRHAAAAGARAGDGAVGGGPRHQRPRGGGGDRRRGRARRGGAGAPRAATPEIKAALATSTAAAEAAGVFGVPTFVVRHASAAPQLYWGADRLTLAAAAAGGDASAM